RCLSTVFYARATSVLYTLSLHDALPIFLRRPERAGAGEVLAGDAGLLRRVRPDAGRGAAGTVAGLVALPRHRRRLALPLQRFRAGQLRLLPQDPGRPAGDAAALETGADRAEHGHGRGLRPALRRAG